MPLEWTPALSVGIEEIDAQHRELFRRAARLLEQLHAGDTDDIGRTIDFLHQYAIVHFGAEETAMRAARYPGLARHKSEHDRFLHDLLALADERDRSGPGAFLAVRASALLKDWLVAHVSGTDAMMARFLRGSRS